MTRDRRDGPLGRAAQQVLALNAMSRRLRDRSQRMCEDAARALQRAEVALRRSMELHDRLGGTKR